MRRIAKIPASTTYRLMKNVINVKQSNDNTYTYYLRQHITFATIEAHKINIQGATLQKKADNIKNIIYFKKFN